LNKLLIDAFEKLNIPADDMKISRFKAYCDFLLKKNRVTNLTAIDEPTQVYIRHFIDSVSLLSLYDFKNKSMIDIGSGAGFPGLALKIAEPSLKITLLDSNGRKVEFLREVCGLLGLADVTCVQARAEELAREPGFREGYDIAAARAVAELSALCELALPFVSPGGVFFAMKAFDSLDEINRAQNAIEKLGGRLLGKKDYTLFATDRQNSAVIIEKATATPGIYPRKFAKIKKTPL
jgi:16S rRNA (guanine527-N7)-methyltransferase